MKKKLALGIVSAFLLSGSLAIPAGTAEARSLQEMQNEKNNLQNESSQLNGKIENRQKNMNDLEQQRTQLEEEVVEIQMSIDELKEKIQAQEETLKELEEEIKELQEEIEYLKEQIAIREEKLQTQARAIQTQGNVTNMVDIVVEAESLSDLIGRLGVVSQLVSANKDIVDAQVSDQAALEEKEALVQDDKETAEAVKAELEVNQNKMFAQKKNLDDKIIQVAGLYDLNEQEKESFIKEQNVVAQKTSALNSEINAENKRIAAEKAKKAAAEKAAAEQARKQAATSSSGTTVSASSNQAYSSGFVRPASGHISSRYGYRIHPITKTKKLHAGTDIAGSGPIVAAQSGTVVKAGYNSGWGYYVKINHGGGLQTLYAHMQGNLRVSTGQHVSQEYNYLN